VKHVGEIPSHGGAGAVGSGRAAVRGPLPLAAAVLRSLRPRQWVKNLFVFAALIFSQNLFTPLVWPAVQAFAIFCALSGAVYLVNDVADVEKDRLHPVKRRRPVASGALPRGAAAAIAVVLLAGSLAFAFRLAPRFGVIALAYGALLVAYSVWLKHLVILDVLTVAVGFVLRAVAGAAAVDVDISGWLVICTVLIALFLALGKRRHEYLTLRGEAAAHRPILAEYSEGFLDQMIAVVTASTVTAYALYTMSPETVGKFHTRLLPLTLPFVLYGVFRYLYLLYRRELGGNPSDLMLSDRALLINSLLWLAALVVIIYGPAWELHWLR
jgi:4-hydroxybenzoate polyprenyltransferase